ncbi:sulfatase [Candidatus Halobonum tyrrellensis G22]|uniref:Sulfatase n=2 Tax=Candidatus Halobonum TaxID=1431544 RepID=V4HA52_9EURY|nr:sulfatase [Candidatus Halobonum tyrrellensis G22]
MRRNVVVLCLDAVRADTFAARASRLSDLADVRVTGCRTAGGWTAPAHASMLTGLLAHDHGVHARSPRYDSLDPADTLVGDLDGHAVGVSATPHAGSASGFDRLFDEFHDVTRSRPDPRGFDARAVADEADGRIGRRIHLVREALAHDAPGASLANAARAAADRLARGGTLGHEPAVLDDGARAVARLLRDRVTETERDAPVFAFADFAEACAPLVDRRGLVRGTVPRGWSSADAGLTPEAVVADPDEYVEELAFYRHLYAENVAYLDRVCADLVADLREATERETTVVVTADHGENLFDDPDDPAFGHVGSLSEAVLHVPFVLVDPPAGYPPVVDGLASHLDFRALVRGLAADETPGLTAEGDPESGDVAGDERAVAAELVGVAPGGEALAARDPERWDRVRRAVYPHDAAKLCWDDRGERTEYELDPDDPCRQRRVATGTGGAPGWAEAVFGEPVAETDERTRRGGDAGADGRDRTDDADRRADPREVGSR